LPDSSWFALWIRRCHHKSSSVSLSPVLTVSTRSFFLSLYYNGELPAPVSLRRVSLRQTHLRSWFVVFLSDLTRKFLRPKYCCC
ncbi:hypothetical protein cypCar_00024983, partial [Cyprinus carpio]